MAVAKKAVAKKAVATKTVSTKAAAPVVQVRNDRIDWRSLYLYAVSLITLLICLFTAISIINQIANLILPETNFYYDSSSTPTGMTKEAYLQQMHTDSQRRAIKALVGSIALLGASLPLYLHHWKLARKNL
jgi:hypothetical protein